MAESPLPADTEPETEMREWIRANMVARTGSTLVDLRDRAAKVAVIGEDGIIRPRSGTSLPSRERILSSFIGRHYAVAGGLAGDSSIENRELVESLSLPKGTVGRCLKELRDAHMIQSVADGRHVLPVANLERALAEIEKISD